MCNKAVDNYPHALEFVPECFVTKKMYDRAINTYPSTINVSECFTTQEMCNEAVNKYFFVFDSIADQYITQEICDRVVSEDPFFIVHCPNKYKISDWFVTSKMIKKLFTALYVDENILHFNEDSGDVFDCNEMGILNTDINNISLDNNFDEDDLHNIILI